MQPRSHRRFEPTESAMSQPPHPRAVHPFSPQGLLGRLTLAGAALLVSGCSTSKKIMDPTVLVRTAGGLELGVSTDYGVVFLGRTSQAGDADLTVWFGDGPSLEQTLIEPVGDGLYTLETEIRLPTVPLAFDQPAAGDELMLIGRDVNGTLKLPLIAASDPRVEGLIFEVPPELSDGSDQTGAGIYQRGLNGELQLLGLLSGRLRLSAAGPAEPGTPAEVEFLTAVGPTSLWRLVAYRRDRHLAEPWVYRNDIL
jgi:hypothetical protein